MNDIKDSLLKIVGYQLFGGNRPIINADILTVLEEAKAQTVFTTVFPFVQDEMKKIYPTKYEAFQEDFFRHVILNTNNFQEHNELHELMSSKDIPYVVIKGLSSASYYPDPSLRDMGDVDYLVFEADFENATQAALSVGFEIDLGEGSDIIHTALKREPMSVWEQHRSINGVPDGKIGELIQQDIDTIIKTAQLIEIEGSTCRIPNIYHHGLIILLHMISHMTSEGIGLRHLCDWAVFADRLDNDEFVKLFKAKLQRFGLWKYVQIMTAVSEKYLGIKHKQWAENSQIDDILLQGVIEDILNGGNFGKKDLNRYREIKYISHRNEHTVDNRNIVIQVFGTLNQKVIDDYKFINQHRLLMPIGWIAEGSKYIRLLVTGKRKSNGTSAMLKEAASRKDIYSRMGLFEVK